jgi:hypothetical protein
MDEAVVLFNSLLARIRPTYISGDQVQRTGRLAYNMTYSPH